MTDTDLAAIERRIDAFTGSDHYQFTIDEIGYDGHWAHDTRRLIAEVKRIDAWRRALSERVSAKNAELNKTIQGLLDMGVQLAKARSECAALAAKVGEGEEEWAIRVVTEPGGAYSYHNYCDPENPERDLETTLRVLADGHDGYGNPVPHGPVSIVKRTVWSTEWETVDPSGMPHAPAEDARGDFLHDDCRVVGCSVCSERGRVEPEKRRPPAQEGRGDADTAGTETDRGTGVPEAPGSTQAIEAIREVWTSCDCDEDLAALAEAVRPVHYREAAGSLRKLGDTAAADLLDSVARDLEDGE
jgi:hypothetical protein